MEIRFLKMQNCNETKLEKLLSFSNGRTSPERSDKSLFAVYGSNGIIGFSEETNAPENTIIVGRVGSYCGSLYFSKSRCWVTDNAIKANAKDDNDPDFLFYLLKTLNLNDKRAGSGQPLLNQSTLNSIKVDVPKPQVQKTIGNVLKRFDSKIELNRQMNTTLEEMARALFKAWFVDFEPVRANMENRSSESASPETAKLFPSEFENGIPKGWESTYLREHLEITRGLSYKGSGLSKKGEGIPMHNLNSIFEGGGYKYEGIKFYTGDFREKHLAKPGDIIVANTEQGHKHLLIGFPAVVPTYFGEKTIFSHHIYRVRPNTTSPLTPQFIYYLLQIPSVRDTIVSCSTGTTVNMLKMDGLEIPEFYLPSRYVIQHFSKFAETIWQKQQAIYQENECLAKMRDLLLPRLISGRLQIVDKNRSEENTDGK